MTIDGRAIGERIYQELRSEIKKMPTAPHMTVITCAPDFATQKYLQLKKRKATLVGVALNIVEFSEDSTTEEIVESINTILPTTDGIVIQLPLPSHINKKTLIEAIPQAKDPDSFQFDGSPDSVLPPVPAAIAEIAKTHNIDFYEKNVVILGHGQLVGAPSALYVKSLGALLTVVTEATEEPLKIIKSADIIISGIGKPNYVKPDMVKDGVIIFDAGTSETSGQLTGDVDQSVAAKAAFFTPVPGGIGPVTVACLLRNLILLLNEQKSA